MATRTKKIERENVAVRILIFEERGAWFGVALEMNLVVEAKTQARAYKRLIDAINGYVAALKQEHLSYDLLRGTPDKEYEKLWRKGMTLYERHRAARGTLHGHAVLSPFQVGFQLVC